MRNPHGEGAVLIVADSSGTCMSLVKSYVKYLTNLDFADGVAQQCNCINTKHCWILYGPLGFTGTCRSCRYMSNSIFGSTVNGELLPVYVN